MRYSGFELFWLFSVYSFLGWILETVFAAIRQKNFVNRGWINGPFCITYGIAAAVITVVLQGLDGIWLFVGIMIDTTVIEWIAGHLIERLYHERWWNYSERKCNLDGYVCLGASLLWGVLGFLAFKWLNRLVLPLYRFLPGILRQLMVWCLAGIFALDLMASYMLVSGRKGNLDRWAEVDSRLAQVSARLGKWIAGHIERRLQKAYPKARRTQAQARAEVFAAGCGFYKLVLLFAAGAFLGDLVETIYCRFSLGRWMSRSSLVWGPFSIVWGAAIAGATALLYKYKDRSLFFLFAAGTLLGGAYEYCCSVLGELVFGKIFWDYSGIPLNLGGRINLLFCCFWGLAAVLWFKVLYPAVNQWIEKIPAAEGKIITWILAVFLTADMAVSAMALIRYDQRGRAIEAKNVWECYLDEHYDDAKMEKIYPKAKVPPDKNRTVTFSDSLSEPELLHRTSEEERSY